MTMCECVFLHMGIFFSSGRRSFLVLSAPGHAGSPPEHHGASVGPGRGPRHVLWGFKVSSHHGEAFRARRAIQVHPNPCKGEKNVRRIAQVVHNSADGSHLLPAHLTLVLKCPCSCSSAPRAHARVLVGVFRMMSYTRHKLM